MQGFGWGDEVDFQTRRDTGVAMLNGYFDFNAHSKFRPYVGAGMGIAITSVKETYYYDPYFGNAIQNQQYYFPNQNRADDNRGNQLSHQNYTFAWALMTGVAYKLTTTLDLDIGYRYLNIGNIRSGGTYAVDAASGGPREFTNYAHLDHVGEHQVRAGLRYKFDN